MAIETSAIYAGILMLLMLVLGARVSILRRKHRVSMGSGDQPDLAKALRVFGNFTEWVPMIIVGLALCELVGAPAVLLHLIGIALIVSRVAHVIGLRPERATTTRTTAVLLTWACAAATGGYLVYAAVI